MFIGFFGNKIQWYLNQNTGIFVKKKLFVNVVGKLLALFVQASKV